ncbi:MoxR family ATPase [Streptomyces sp. TLI_146]|uniref:AAA family ATPase n=1 Tax=Streptomyces sp. TLI_146 TaxID=1938858 RepID=UPI000C70C604|nr:MoxR family ATPase [Streptomyces sp. TLI_146]PKV88611.1 dynein-related subfamily AAA family protein [Streptomyces sp. TLI_146]
MSLWPVYTGGGEPHDGITQLPPPPPWRAFNGKPVLPPPSEDPDDAASSPDRTHRAETYVVTEQSVELVNAALYLRRPLLVTGPPGSGKSSLPYAVARELMLGPVLRWNVTSRSTLDDGLYQYDPLSRLYAAREEGRDDGWGVARREQIADHLRLGPLGTALLPHLRPRVLLIDEIDKGDLDLPNDLLNVLEEGQFEIPELVRTAHRDPEAHIMVAGADDRVPVHRGRIRCHAFPFVVLTSNGEREFPPAFLRRCVTLELKQPDKQQLKAIVEAHLGQLDHDALELVDTFLHRASGGELATDQLLNAVYLTRTSGLQGASREQLAEHLMPYLSQQLEPEGLRPDEF